MWKKSIALTEITKENIIKMVNVNGQHLKSFNVTLGLR